MVGIRTNAPLSGGLRGVSGKNYRVVSCALRNYGAPNYWQPISDATHAPLGVASVVTDTTSIVVNYDFTATRVLGGYVTPDEALAVARYGAGPSVGLSAMTINLSRDSITDYITYNAGTSAWVSTNGSITAFSWGTPIANNLKMDHAPIGGIGYSVTARDSSPLIAKCGSAGATASYVAFYNAAGAIQTTPSADMKFFFVRHGGGSINPQLGGLESGANLWVYAILEV